MKKDLRKVDLFEYVDSFKRHEHVESILIKKSEDVDYFLTIVIPTYKRPVELKEALDSALDQSRYGELFSYEVLVIDNNPERGDETEQLLSGYDNSNLSYYKNSENLGMFGNWNRGFLLGRGEWLTMLHDDDALQPYFLSVLKPFLVRRSGALFPQQIQGPEFKSEPKPEGAIKTRRIYCEDLLKICCSAPVGLTLYKEQFIATGGFNEDFYPSGDYAWYVTFSYRYRMDYILTPLVFYRNTVSVSRIAKIQSDMGFMNFYIRRSIAKRKFLLPCGVIDYTLGNIMLKYNKDAIKIGLTTKEFELKLSDIDLDENSLTNKLVSPFAFKIWELWILWMRISVKLRRLMSKELCDELN